MVARNFLTFYVLAGQTPRGGKTRNTRILGHFGLGWPLALEEIPGPGRKRKKRNFLVLGVPKQKKNLPRYPGWLSATFLHVIFWPTGPSGAGNQEKRVFQAILAQDGLWHLEKSRARAENGKTQFPGARGPEIEKKKLPRYPGLLSATFLRFMFCPTGPPRAGNRKIRVF